MHLQTVISRPVYERSSVSFHKELFAYEFCSEVLFKYFAADPMEFPGKFCVLEPQMALSEQAFIQANLFVDLDEQDCQSMAQNKVGMTMAQDTGNFLQELFKDIPIYVTVYFKTHGPTGEAVEDKIFHAQTVFADSE